MAYGLRRTVHGLGRTEHGLDAGLRQRHNLARESCGLTCNCARIVERSNMKKLESLRQPPFNTCLVGVVKGALDYFGSDKSASAAFGGSGHAFLMNIHEQLCPSGPYCWKYDEFYPLVRNLGLEVIELGFCHNGSTPEERAAIERKVREHLDQGQPCGMGNMDNQLIYGYDDKQLLAIQPWGTACCTTPPGLTFGTWAEFGKEVHATFWAFEKAPAADESKVVRDSLLYALDLFENPRSHSPELYATGPAAYDNWVKAVEAGHGASHGSWWNGVVWSECRAMAGAWFEELGNKHDHVSAQTRKLGSAYKEIAARLEKVSNKDMDAGEKVRVVREAKALEQEAIGNIGKLLAAFGR